MVLCFFLNVNGTFKYINQCYKDKYSKCGNGWRQYVMTKCVSVEPLNQPAASAHGMSMRTRWELVHRAIVMRQGLLVCFFHIFKISLLSLVLESESSVPVIESCWCHFLCTYNQQGEQNIPSKIEGSRINFKRESVIHRPPLSFLAFSFLPSSSID